MIRDNKLFLNLLKNANSFSSSFTVLLGDTNLEGNVYHSVFFEYANNTIEKFLMDHHRDSTIGNASVPVPDNAEIRYIGNLYFGDIIRITLSLQESENDYFIVRLALQKDGVLKNEIYYRYLIKKKEDALKKYDFRAQNTYSLEFLPNLSLFSSRGIIEIINIASLFGKAREQMGLDFIKNFSSACLSEFLLITMTAEYQIHKAFDIDSKSMIRSFVQVGKILSRGFVLKAEFTDKAGNIFASANQMIGFASINGKLKKLPCDFKNNLRLLVPG